MTASLTRRGFVVSAGVVGAVLPGRAMAAAASDPVRLVDPRLDRHWADDAIMLADPMRQWRAGLGAEVVQRGGFALVRWDLALMLRQLGRESRLSVRVRPYAGGLFGVMLMAASPRATADSAAPNA